MIEPGLPKPLPTLAYLTSAYARASDTFIRGEVAQLRKLGHTVHTFSIRKSDPREAVDESVRRERVTTEYLLAAGISKLGAATFRSIIRSPRRFLEAARLALETGTPGLKGRLWPLAYLVEAAYLAERLHTKEVEHLHNHIGEGSATVAMLASLLADVPFSLTIHGPGEFDQPGMLALDHKIKRCQFTAAISDYGKSQLYRWTDHADWPKIEVVHCGLDETFLGQGHVPVPDVRRLVCVGRLAEQKGQLILIEAVALLAEQGHEFEVVLIGDGPMRPLIDQRLETLGIESHVKLAGWMGAEAVRDELLRSRALVLPSFAEGLPVVLMEALALGRPVISTTIAGIPELVVHGECGWLVPPGSVDSLADAMRSALSTTTSELDRMGRYGAERAARRHDGAVEAQKLSDLFQRSSPSPVPSPISTASTFSGTAS